MSNIQSVIVRVVMTLVVLQVGNANTLAQESLTEQLQKESVERLKIDAQKFGDPTRGAAAFFQSTMNCARCHEQNEQGRRLGPNLAEKREVTSDHLIESLLNPSAKIKEGFETVQVLLEDGKILTGVMVQETDDYLRIDQIELAEKPLDISKDEIEDWQKTTVSTMPIELPNQLANRQQFLDLVSYLMEIADGGAVVADQLRPAAAVLAPLPEYESRIDHVGLIKGLNSESMKRGAETYRLRCASCHGTVTQEGSMPTSLRFASGKFKHGSDPKTMYRTLTHGYGMMNPQRWMVPEQKYDVIHYIRETFLRQHNASQYFRVNDAYLASLPVGNTRGPKPVKTRPWSQMDYGPSLNNTIEVSDDGSNIAQKGIVIRLDDGPGGVESGQYWMLYEHDTMRVAGAWQGSFIDYEGIHLNGAHQRHPSITGTLAFSNPTAPGFARPASSIRRDTDNTRPTDDAFADDRVLGRDDKHYGPLPKDWARYEGLYRFGHQTILKYRVGKTSVFESPSLSFDDDTPVFTRTLELGRRDEPMVIQVAGVAGDARPIANVEGSQVIAILPRDFRLEDQSTTKAAPKEREQQTVIPFDGSRYFQLAADGFDMTEDDYSIVVRMKAGKDGTIFSKTKDQADWVPQGISLFVQDGRPTLDIGWVGAVRAKRRINDGKFHDVVMTWSKGMVRFFIDGKPAGGGPLKPASPVEDAVIRIGKTNDNFPAETALEGSIEDLRFYQRALNENEIKNTSKLGLSKLVARWNHETADGLTVFGKENNDKIAIKSAQAKAVAKPGLVASINGIEDAAWAYENGQLRLKVPAGPAVSIAISHVAVADVEQAERLPVTLARIKPRVLSRLTKGGPANYPEVLTAQFIRGDDAGPFAVDVFERPKDNPWNCRIRLTGIDFMPDPNQAVVTAWDGSVWMVTGIAQATNASEDKEGGGEGVPVKWRRFAYGLFQPLGVRVVEGVPHVICRDQIVALHDLNHDGEADWYRNFNSDHQVTEHFHEFAAGLQTDAENNFYYAKCACHAKKALVPQHGTLLKVSADGSETEILANGFRAANGVCLNDDGSFFVTDQEGHWTPKNRINHVKRGGFYGNMLGYHNDRQEADDAMEKPLAWITNAFDRSPAELLWVTSDQWGPLQGSLLNFSYGYGQIYVVPHESVDGQMQGGMAKLPIAQFPTGIMRGRFHPVDGQLYCCGMFAWAGTQQQPGGMYRVRYNRKPIHVPTGMKVIDSGVELTMTESLDRDSAEDPSNYRVEVWGLKRTSNYGSKHQNQRVLEVSKASLADNGKSVRLTIEGIEPTRGLKILYSVQDEQGNKCSGELHGSIHAMPGK